MATRRESRTAAHASVAHANRTATGTPAGWSRRAARRALQAGTVRNGVYAVELRPGGAVRYILQRRQGTHDTDIEDVRRVEAARKDGTVRQKRDRGAPKSAEPAVESAETAGADASMVVDQAGSSKQLGRSRARLVGYGKAMGFLKSLVFKRWMEAVQQEKQQKQEQQRAEAAAAAEAATAAAAAAAREQELAALRRELTEARAALRSERRAKEGLQKREPPPKRPQSPAQDHDADMDGSEPLPTMSAAFKERRLLEDASEALAAKGRGRPGGRGKGRSASG